MKDNFESQCSAVDKQMLKALLVENADRLLRYIRAKVRRDLQDVVTAEDVLQEVWVAVLKRSTPPQLIGSDAFYRWVLTVTNNTLVDIRKSVKAIKRGGNWAKVEEPRYGSSNLDPLGGYASTWRTPSREYAAIEAADAVQCAVTELPDAQRDVVKLRLLQGQSTVDVASELNTTPAAVRALMARGLFSMRKRLGRAARFFSDASTETMSEAGK